MGILRWVGGKQKLLKTLRPYLDQVLCGALILHEPYVGGGAVVLDTAKRYPGIHLSVNDADPGVSSLYTLLGSGSAQQLRDLERMLDIEPTLDLWDELKAERPEDPIRLAFRTTYLSRTSYSGNLTGGPMGGRRQTRTKIGDRYNPKNIVREIHKARDLLVGRLDVHCMDATEYLRDVVAGQRGAASYIDPPYVIAGPSCYVHSMTEDEHRALAEELRRHKGWVLSLDDCGLARELYADANIRSIEAPYSASRATSARREQRTELLITPAGQGAGSPPERRSEKSFAVSEPPYLSPHTNSEVQQMSKNTTPVGPEDDRPYDPFLTVAIPRFALSKEEVAVMCGVSTRTVDGWIEKGLKVRMLGKSIARITLSDLNEFLRDAPTA